MSSTRSIIAPPTFAANALTTIPATPVAGVSYRDPVAGPTSSPDGWPYAERVNSAEFNQIMYQATSIISLVDKKGVLGWSDQVDYSESAIVLGSDGSAYEWVLSSGPSFGGAKDPISNSPTYWRMLSSGRLLNIQKFTTSGTYTPTPGTRSIIVECVGGGGGAGGAPATAAGQTSLGAGGGGGAYSKGQFTTGFSGLAITIGAGGVGGTGAAGSVGGTTSLGSLITAPGGGAGQTAGPSNAQFFVGSSSVGVGVGGNIESQQGAAANYGTSLNTTTIQIGSSGPSHFGPGIGSNVGSTGTNAVSFGSGGGGTGLLPSAAALKGGNGKDGYMIIWELS